MEKSQPPQPNSTDTDESLFDRVGGDAALEAAVDLFYKKILADDSVCDFFEGVDMDAQRDKQRSFIKFALGAAPEYTGKSLAEAHAALVDKGLNDAHFDAVAGHLQDTLKELEVSDDLVEEVISVIAGTREDVLTGPAHTETPVGGEKDAEADAMTQEKSTAKESVVASQSIRVTVDLLENLMNMVSELVLTRNQLMQMVRGQRDSEFTVPLQRLSHVTTDLQEGVMQTRMQPIGNAWAKLPRIVRDLAIELDKKIELEMRGADTELDRQVLELIKDPLTHMVRNSGDHGIESPAERAAAGKPETGKIILNAFHEGGHIIVEISDDGAGLPIKKLGAKAVASGLTTEAQLESMSDQQILQFIFKPGFSTAEKVTSVSGRGVGMDVVRTNVDKIGGTIDVKSQEGKGTTITVKIPLTLAIVSALIVACAGERFAIPQLSVVELVGVSGETANKIETINKTPVLRLRNRLLPLVNLREVLGLEVEETDQPDADDQTSNLAHEADVSNSFIIVTQVGNYTFGIVVDKVFDTEEIVVKPVAPILREISVFSGNTILDDGSVIMILDPNGIAKTTGELSMPEKDAREKSATQETWNEEQVALLVFRAGGKEPKAVPLALIARLEELDIETIEVSDGEMVVQYRGSLMPLVKLNTDYEAKTEGRQPVLVFSDHERTMGLIVDEIVDIVEEQLNIELASSTPGLIGTAVVAGRATEVIDASHYLDKAFGDWFKANSSGAYGANGGRQRVLLVDDSAFFRNLLSPVLATAGYEVTTAEDAQTALRMREAGHGFDIIVSDIEMPGMSGFEFAEEVKGDKRWKQTPLVALSSHHTTEDVDRGRAAGFSDYVAKLDRSALLQSISQTLSQGNQ
ncbi:MAG: chemotaxis protein CheW [Proteobacteria bacterium]|nr:chemotaxis protein CheW [Pseudomonadota bacterium]